MLDVFSYPGTRVSIQLLASRQHWGHSANPDGSGRDRDENIKQQQSEKVDWYIPMD